MNLALFGKVHRRRGDREFMHAADTHVQVYLRLVSLWAVCRSENPRSHDQAEEDNRGGHKLSTPCLFSWSDNVADR